MPRLMTQTLFNERANRLRHRVLSPGEGATLIARSIGKNTAGDIAAEFEVAWSFKRPRLSLSRQTVGQME